jgi:hypothetical protein
MPKSTSLVTPSYDTIRLWGETSRWTSPSGVPSASLEAMGVGQGAGGVGADPRDQGWRQAIGHHLGHELAGVDAVDVLHRDEEVAVDLPELVDVDDVRVGQARGQPRLRQEHLHEVGRLGQVREDALDRDPAIEPPRGRAGAPGTPRPFRRGRGACPA